MGRPSSRAWVVALIALGAIACGKSKSAPDAGPAPPPRPAFVRPVVAPGELSLDTARSKIQLTIIKDRDTKNPVLASLAARDGAIALARGTARLSVDIDTFDSGIPLRNERVRGIIFETSAVGWESAELTIPKIPDDVLASLTATKSAHATLDADLKVHGRVSKLILPLDVGYTPTGALSVKSARPIEIKISDLGLTDNLKRLSALCMHDSIDDLVTADVSLEFASR